MTIPRLSISLKGVFEYGQAYVALSRATELKNLVLTGFHENAFKAHPKVKSFYQLLMEPEIDAGVGLLSLPTPKSYSMKMETKSSSLSTSADADLTPEQLQRMENNRQRAIFLRKQKENEMQKANVSFL
jgi:hypothetical protein